jgi:hypothetical protein
VDGVKAELAAKPAGAEAGPVFAQPVRQNALVVPLGHGWYRYHPMFREALRLVLRHEARLFETAVRAATEADGDFQRRSCLAYLSLIEARLGRFTRAAELVTRAAHLPEVSLHPAGRRTAVAHLASAAVHLEHYELSVADEELDRTGAALAECPGRAALRRWRWHARGCAAASPRPRWCAMPSWRLKRSLQNQRTRCHQCVLPRLRMSFGVHALAAVGATGVGVHSADPLVSQRAGSPVATVAARAI